MLSLFIKEARHLPIFDGICYGVVNYKVLDWQTGDEIIERKIKFFFTRLESVKKMMSKLDDQSTILEIRAFSGRIFHEVSAMPALNQVMFLPYTVFKVTEIKNQV
jgi:hypothetical protein